MTQFIAFHAVACVLHWQLFFANAIDRRMLPGICYNRRVSFRKPCEDKQGQKCCTLLFLVNEHCIKLIPINSVCFYYSCLWKFFYFTIIIRFYNFQCVALPPDRLVGAEDARLHRAAQPGQVGLTPDVVMGVDEFGHAAFLCASESRVARIAWPCARTARWQPGVTMATVS